MFCFLVKHFDHVFSHSLGEFFKALYGVELLFSWLLLILKSLIYFLFGVVKRLEVILKFFYLGWQNAEILKAGCLGFIDFQLVSDLV